MNDRRWADEAQQWVGQHDGRFICPQCGNDDYNCEHVCLECRAFCPTGMCDTGMCVPCDTERR